MNDRLVTVFIFAGDTPRPPRVYSSMEHAIKMMRCVFGEFVEVIDPRPSNPSIREVVVNDGRKNYLAGTLSTVAVHGEGDPR